RGEGRKDSRLRTVLRSILLTLTLPALAGAGFPEVVRVRVPAAKVATYFPPGTELRGMPSVEFEALVTAARDGFRKQQRAAGPRLLRARHAVRWEAGRLSGRSELLVEAAQDGLELLVLDPWTPAVDSKAPAAVLNLP